MRPTISRRLAVGAAVALTLLAAGFVFAQGQGGGQQPPAAPAVAPRTPKAAAPIDLTGYWVSIVDEDWRWRMVTPPKGDYASVPITRAAKEAADKWDPAKDEAAGEQCRSYGAPAIMAVPERVHITWQDDNTLKLETDAGQQTRLFHFGNWKPAPNAAATWQGDSVAEWEIAGGPNGRGGRGGAMAAPQPRTGDLKVVTTHIRPGYLRKNGIPYSAQAVLTEYWDMSTEKLLSGPHKDEQWMVITTVVHDPQYLAEDWITSLHFKKEPDGSKWDPQPCSSRW
jgi:hypothetical protein